MCNIILLQINHDHTLDQLLEKIEKARFRWLSGLERTSMIAVVQLRLLSIQTRSQPMRKKFPQAQKHRKRVMGYRVRQPILCIGDR